MCSAQGCPTLLGKLGRSQDAADVVDEVVRRFGQDPNAAVRIAAERAGRALDDLQR